MTVKQVLGAALCLGLGFVSSSAHAATKCDTFRLITQAASADFADLVDPSRSPTKLSTHTLYPAKRLFQDESMIKNVPMFANIANTKPPRYYTQFDYSGDITKKYESLKSDLDKCFPESRKIDLKNTTDGGGRTARLHMIVIRDDIEFIIDYTTCTTAYENENPRAICPLGPNLAAYKSGAFPEVYTETFPNHP